MYRRIRPSSQGKLILGIVVVILLIIIFSALAANCRSNKHDNQQDKPPVDITIEKSSKINVYTGGSTVSMDLEEYLVGVVAAEMPASFEPEALKAQAVAARTYTLYKKQNGGCSAHSGSDICADSSHCQAYVTVEQMRTNWDDNFDKYYEKISLAVASTSGEVMLYDGETIQVFYHASAGGWTENVENVYQQALPYLVSVKSVGEEDSSRYYGTVSVSYSDFISKMKAFSPSIKIDDAAFSIGQIKRFDSGRVESIKIGNETFTGREIRSIFGLNSTNFSIDTQNGITFSTVGFGHGVGMSQEGANSMAKNGADYIEILTHYYTGITIR